MNGITFNGVHSSTKYIKSIKSRRPLFAETKDTFVDVPHKSGAILIFDTSKLDIDVEVDCWLDIPAGKTLFDCCREISTWLTTQLRVMLIFDDDPNYAYKAKVVSTINVEDIGRYNGQFTIVFRCEPDMIEVIA